MTRFSSMVNGKSDLTLSTEVDQEISTLILSNSKPKFSTQSGAPKVNFMSKVVVGETMELNEKSPGEKGDHCLLSLLRQINDDKVQYFLEHYDASQSCLVKSTGDIKSDSLEEKLRDAGFTLNRIVALKNAELVKLLLDQGHHLVNEKDSKDGRTALHVAVKNCNFKMVQLLVDYGADVDALDSSTCAPIWSLRCEGTGDDSAECLEILKILLSRATLLTTCRHLGFMQIRNLLIYGCMEAVELVLQRIDDLYVTDEMGNTVVHYVALNCNADVIETLRDRSFDINARNNEGDTPLHLAAERHVPGSVEFFLENGANVHVRDVKDEETPLVRVFKFFVLSPNDVNAEAKKCIQLLLEYGSDPLDANLVKKFHLVSQFHDIFRAPVDDEPREIRGTLNVMEPILAHMAVGEARGIEIDEFSLSKIRLQPLWVKYLDMCRREVKKMKKTMVYGKLTLFEFLTGSERKISVYVCNEELVSELERAIEKFEANSPCPDLLRNRLVRATKSAEMKEKAAVAICRIVGLGHNAFYLAAKYIVEYLSNIDRRHLLCIWSKYT